LSTQNQPLIGVRLKSLGNLLEKAAITTVREVTCVFFYGCNEATCFVMCEFGMACWGVGFGNHRRGLDTPVSIFLILVSAPLLPLVFFSGYSVSQPQ